MPRASTGSQSGVGVRPSRPAVVTWAQLGASAHDDVAVFKDQRLAEIFRNMRRVLNVSADVMARELRTSRGVIAALEAGAVYALPPWGETHRIVVTYAQRAGVDARPILARLEGYLIYNVAGESGGALPKLPARSVTRAPAYQQQRLSRAHWESMQTPLSHPPRSRKNRRRRALKFVVWSLILAVAGGTLVAARLRPDLLLETARRLPPQVATTALTSAELLVFRAAPLQDGLRWVDMADPRVRKADKLRSAGQ
jgi:hypothetical protein